VELARRIAYHLGPHIHDLLQQRRFLPGIAQPLGRVGLTQVGQDFPDLAQGLHILRAHAQGHAGLCAEQVGQHRNAAAFRVLEQQCGATGAQGAVGDLGHFKVGVHFVANTYQFTALFQYRNEVTKVFVVHRLSWRVLRARGQYSVLRSRLLPAPQQRYLRFMDMKNSSLVLVSLSLSSRNSIAGPSSMLCSSLRRIHMRCSSSSPVSNSSRRVPERRMLMAG